MDGDAFLDFQQADLYELAGERSKAKESLRRAVAREPALAAPHLMLVGIALGEKDFAEAARLLDGIENDCHVKIDDLMKIAPYADFVKSPEYEVWRKAREKR